MAGRVNGLEAGPQIIDALSYISLADCKLGLAIPPDRHQRPHGVCFGQRVGAIDIVSGGFEIAAPERNSSGASQHQRQGSRMSRRFRRLDCLVYAVCRLIRIALVGNLRFCALHNTFHPRRFFCDKRSELVGLICDHSQTKIFQTS